MPLLLLIAGLLATGAALLLVIFYRRPRRRKAMESQATKAGEKQQNISGRHEQRNWIGWCDSVRRA